MVRLIIAKQTALLLFPTETIPHPFQCGGNMIMILWYQDRLDSVSSSLILIYNIHNGQTICKQISYLKNNIVRTVKA